MFFMLEIFVILCFLYILFEIMYKMDCEYEIFTCRHTSICRGVATVLILLQHFIGNTTNLRVFTPLGGVGVCIFLILSGYGLNQSASKCNEIGYWKRYWKNKLLKVFIPYALFELILLSYDNVNDIGTYILDITGIRPEFWYFQHLYICYLTFYISMRWEKIRKYKYIILSASAVLLFVFGTNLEAEQCVSFLVGVLISDYSKYLKELFQKKRVLLIMMFISIGMLFLKQLEFVRFYEGTYISYIVNLLIKLPAALYVIGLVYKCRYVFTNKLFLLFNDMSLEYYVIHLAMLKMNFIGSIFNSYVDSVIFILLSMVLAFVYKNAMSYIGMGMTKIMER